MPYVCSQWDSTFVGRRRFYAHDVPNRPKQDFWSDRDQKTTIRIKSSRSNELVNWSAAYMSMLIEKVQCLTRPLRVPNLRTLNSKAVWTDCKIWRTKAWAHITKQLRRLQLNRRKKKRSTWDFRSFDSTLGVDSDRLWPRCWKRQVLLRKA